MKKHLLFFVAILLPFGFVFACSTFLLNIGGQLLFGRNYDWVSGNGMVVTNARGLFKTALVAEGEKPATWTAKYGSLTFNQFGKEFPHGGMNEKGLVVELMWLDETSYPAPDNRDAVSELQWIQYQLDNCSSVNEVLATDRHIRISQKNAVPLHFLVADASGQAATVEFMNGKLVSHNGSSLPSAVLTNTPYEVARQIDSSRDASTADNSQQRFSAACRRVQQLQKAGRKETAVSDAFQLLSEVAQGDFTKWKIVYDISNREVHFLTANKRKSLRLADFDFSCQAKALYLDVNTKQGKNVKPYFSPLLFAENKRILQQSATESKSQVAISDESINRVADYFLSVNCQK